MSVKGILIVAHLQDQNFFRFILEKRFKKKEDETSLKTKILASVQIVLKPIWENWKHSYQISLYFFKKSDQYAVPRWCSGNLVLTLKERGINEIQVLTEYMLEIGYLKIHFELSEATLYIHCRH